MGSKWFTGGVVAVLLAPTNLAADLPVPSLIHTLCASTSVPDCIFWPGTNPLLCKEKIAATQLEELWLGWKDYSALRASPLRGRPRGR